MSEPDGIDRFLTAHPESPVVRDLLGTVNADEIRVHVQALDPQARAVFFFSASVGALFGLVRRDGSRVAMNTTSFSQTRRTSTRYRPFKQRSPTRESERLDRSAVADSYSGRNGSTQAASATRTNRACGQRWRGDLPSSTVLARRSWLRPVRPFLDVRPGRSGRSLTTSSLTSMRPPTGLDGLTRSRRRRAGFPTSASRRSDTLIGAPNTSGSTMRCE